jgi:hypothetical protein
MFLAFEDARTLVRTFNLKNSDEWLAWTKSAARPSNIPASPAQVYKNRGWACIGDWLGTGAVANQDRTYLPFAEARVIAHSLNLATDDQPGFPKIEQMVFSGAHKWRYVLAGSLQVGIGVATARERAHTPRAVAVCV